MADVYAVFGTLLALGIAYPGMLAAWRLLFPGFVQRSQARLEVASWGSLGLGAGVGLPTIAVSALLISIPAPFLTFIGVVLAVFSLTLASIGAAGLAGKMGVQLNEMSAGSYSLPGAHIRGAVALELVSVFPFIGWLLVLPLATLTCFGAGVHTLFSRSGRDSAAMDVRAPQTIEA